MWICDGAARKRDRAEAQACISRGDTALAKARDLRDRFATEADGHLKALYERDKRIADLNNLVGDLNKHIGELTAIVLALTKRIEAAEAAPAPGSKPARNVGRDANGRYCKAPA
jgi:hypothetical protein